MGPPNTCFQEDFTKQCSNLCSEWLPKLEASGERSNSCKAANANGAQSNPGLRLSSNRKRKLKQKAEGNNPEGTDHRWIVLKHAAANVWA